MKSKGFTLIEVAIVMMILGTLIAMGVDICNGDDGEETEISEFTESYK